MRQKLLKRLDQIEYMLDILKDEYAEIDSKSYAEFGKHRYDRLNEIDEEIFQLEAELRIKEDELINLDRKVA